MVEAIPRRMRALIIAGPRKASVEMVDTPSPAPGEVLVQVEGCGVCGSNLPAWEGRSWFHYPLPPGAPGHEGWGRVVSTGERVSFLSNRAFAEYATASALCRIPDGLAFPGEAFGCIMNIYRRAGIRPGDRVAIVGIGFLGAGLVELAVGNGAEVTALTRRRWALDLAKSLGAKHTVTIREDEATVREALEHAPGDGYSVVIEAVGLQSTLALATKLVATRGRLVIAGYHQDGLRQVDMQLWNWRGIDVINAHERDETVYLAGMKAAVDATASGTLDARTLVSHKFCMSDAAQAFHALEHRPDGFLKAVVMP